MADRPRATGTVTFLFTDIEGSTRAWELQPKAMAVALKDHNQLLYSVIETHGGYVFKTVGDGFCCAFFDSSEALLAAIEAMQQLHVHPWPEEIGEICVRMALHTGAAVLNDGDYFGPTVNRVARLMAIAHGGQILLSSSTAAAFANAPLAGVTLRDLGSHRLKDLNQAEVTYQVVADGLRRDFPALASLDSHPNNLPSQISTFVGRQSELDDLRELLANHRLLTIAGPGGIGKTRLALHLAASVIGQFKDGAWIADLTAVRDPALIPQTIASELGLRETPQEPIAGTLLNYLAEKQLLLIVDNAEHLRGDVTRTVRSLLERCAGLTVLVTSREALHLTGEQLYRVSSLPETPVGTESASLMKYDSSRLFLERARDVRPGLAITEKESADVVSLCGKLEGIPLAIELAAARMSTLAVGQLNAHLSSRLDFLASRDSTDQRHRTLRSTIDWSYDLLGEDDKSVFAALAVFVGGFTFETYERVISHISSRALDALESLVDASLVFRAEEEDVTRYHLLDVVNEYSSMRLQGLDTRQNVVEAYVGTFGELAAPGTESASSEDLTHWVELMESEVGNLRSAIDHAIEARNARALEQICGAEVFWRRHIAEGRLMLARVLPVVAGNDRSYQRLLKLSAHWATLQEDYLSAMPLLLEARGIAASRSDPSDEADVMTAIAMVEQRRGKSTEAKAALERARDLYATAGSDRGMLVTTANMAAMSIQTNDLDSADTLLQESLRLERVVDDRRIRAFVYGLLGSLAFNQGAFDKSRNYLATAVEGLVPSSDGHIWSEMLNSLAVVCAREGDVSEADRLVRRSLRTSIELDHHAGVIGALEAAAQICLAEDQIESAQWYYASARFLREQLSYWSHSLLGSDALEARIEEALRDDGKALTKVLEWRAAAERLLDVGLQPSAPA